jgi:hypothetical protein
VVFVSLLQLMGFPAAKPVHSHADKQTVLPVSEPQAQAAKVLTGLAQAP